MVLANDFVPRVAGGREEVVVCTDNRAIELELNHRLRFRNGGDLSFVVRRRAHPLGDVRGVLDDHERLAVLVEDRVIGGLDPDGLAVLLDALVGRAVELAPAQLGPEIEIRGLFPLSGLHKNAVMLTDDLARLIAYGITEISIRLEDMPLKVKMNHRHGLIQRADLSVFDGLFPLCLARSAEQAQNAVIAHD